MKFFCTIPRTIAPLGLALGLAVAIATRGSNADEPASLPAAVAAPNDALSAVDYLREIKPLLEQHCVDCHNAETRQAGLRLDAARLAIQGGDGGAGIAPGKSAESRLIHAVTGDAGDIQRMPLDMDPLSAAQIDLLRRWIDQGAVYPDDEPVAPDVRVTSDHWSFQPIERPAVPVVQQPERLRNPIDAFVLARLEAEGLAPSDEADRTTLLRRLSLDLHGLLPSPADIEEFLADSHPDAYERLVDRLLASPHYGERWGRHWLDAARYADSNGFTIDGARTMWPYRDWVVDALNRDLPFDQFTIEQLAGDLLPEAARNQIVATGFHRNTLANEEGGTDDEQFRVEAVVDRVNTTGAVWMGLTVGCCQCHDHKYDPLAMRDFYRLFAVFNSTADNNDAAGQAPLLRLPTPAQAARREALSAAAAEAKRAKAEHETALAALQSEWESKFTGHPNVEWMTVAPEAVKSSAGTTLKVLEDQSVLAEGTNPPHDTYEVSFTVKLPQFTAVRLEVLPHDGLPMKGPGRAGNGNFVLSEVEFFRVAGGTGNPVPQYENFTRALADHSQDKYPIADVLDGKDDTGWAINVSGGGAMNVRREATLILKQTTDVVLGDVWTLVLKHASPPNKGYQIGRFRIAVTSTPGQLLETPGKIREIVAIPVDQRTDQQKKDLLAAYHASDARWGELAARATETADALRRLDAAIPTTLVMEELPQPRETFVHVRGDFLRKGARVQPGVPEVLPELSAAGAVPNRLDFARWLVDPRHPLTSRVVVNRSWQRLFGLGLVETENDFGLQGSPPSHPELLDWLASELMEQGWSMKAFHRLIVTSATYRQSSRMRPELAERDPQNRLLARQSRVRLEAEIVRDASLSASGLLSERLGGVPVYPPQPEGIYAFTQNRKNWPESQGEDRYRRGMYTFFWRSSPHPMMPTFDAPDATTTCTRRVRSNTPLQALTLANERSFVEIAQALAVRIMREGPEYDAGRIRFAFACVVGRDPSEEENTRLLEILEQERTWFAGDGAAAAAIAPAGRPEELALPEAAAWTAFARVLLNLDEFITRE